MTMERLTQKNADGRYEILEGRTREEVAAKLAGYENAHEFLLEERRRAEARLDALRGQGRKLAFQQALAEKLYLTTLIDRLEHPSK